MMRKFGKILLWALSIVIAATWCLSATGNHQWKWQPTSRRSWVVNVVRGELQVSARLSTAQPSRSVVTDLRHYQIPGMTIHVQAFGTNDAPAAHATRWSAHVSLWWPTVPLLFAWFGYACAGPVRRRRRRRRGRCATCGYDLQGNESGVCPECGAMCRTEGTRAAS